MVLPWLALLLASSVGATLCPDGTACGEDSLCCELPGEQGYGCCPKEEVILRALPMISVQALCSDPSSCPDEYTCVETPQGKSACCPYPQGTSCQDGHHCCPSGTHCSADGQECIPAANQSAIICPDGRSECPNDATCCMMPDQSWGCCPIPQASCCSDHLHCCPHNTQCDTEHGRCISEHGAVPWMRKLSATVKMAPLGETVKRTPCQDGSSCPDGATCCRQKDGSFGCCLFTDAVCCKDDIHCCPSGTRCDLPRQKCVSSDLETPLFQKSPALREKATDVKCDDTASCPDGSTCCRMPTGEWGCCPIVKAVCCSDHIHCCPNGFTCSGDSCIGDGVSIPLLKKFLAVPQKASDVPCDETSSCPDKTTCCRLASGEWGCCPLEQAVCCSDHVHCCPSGYTCSGGKCIQGGLSIPWLKKIPALTQEVTNVQCDEETSCPEGNTCCRLATGEWGCCPIEKAVCCSDHLHCCPSGYTCDVSTGSCNKPQAETPPSVKTSPIQPVDYVWCDSQHACYDGQTCCVGPGGVWTCCPYPVGVCCPDRIHCCPYGHVCLQSGAACSRSGPPRWDDWKNPTALL
ncbi:progranulin [Spea bombifrons]|uniref:progranulin n=1 Tax=Spea bombifrons TaxID=233779 RepID=UPI00234AD771|nr:progranulin [Spea bombifrons]